ncbi:hypothetical protein [Alicyclobacillus tolerans]|uniref:Uncharacterized protein n=2 Tax=Alicyclobacillus tolerans TaxID=90970 RepID=A0A1M6UCC0_9BACL|nr:hypothetical protein [Alicyclobacillus montanus]SHK66895.1 hypothetical protein SAMN05443507_11941 [Alicyclobacillus montanus]
MGSVSRWLLYGLIALAAGLVMVAGYMSWSNNQQSSAQNYAGQQLTKAEQTYSVS